MNQDALDYYATPGRFTQLSADTSTSTDVRTVVEVVQGLLIYDLVAQPFYGVDLSPEQAETVHERDTARVLAAACAVDARPLEQPRLPGDRVGARCHLYSRLTVAFLRHAGVPARARCGFGTYFNPGWLEDHWVAEYWDSTDQRWKMADAQLDDTWKQMIGFDGDAFDLTSEQFVTGGEAWQSWRSGRLDASRCGLVSIDEHGDHWIAGNTRLDFASLNKVEMMPWDVWGDGWETNEQPTDDQLRLYDEVAALTIDPDRTFTDLRDRYETDDSVRMNGTVFNVHRGVTETV